MSMGVKADVNVDNSRCWCVICCKSWSFDFGVVVVVVVVVVEVVVCQTLAIIVFCDSRLCR